MRPPLLTLLWLPILLLAKEDEIDLQWAICDTGPQIALQKLGEDIRHQYKHTPVTFYDTNPPDYAKNGILFRTKIKKGQEVSLIKIRFAHETSDLPVPVDCVWMRYGDDLSFTCAHQSPLNGT